MISETLPPDLFADFIYSSVLFNLESPPREHSDLQRCHDAKQGSQTKQPAAKKTAEVEVTDSLSINLNLTRCTFTQVLCQ